MHYSAASVVQYGIGGIGYRIVTSVVFCADWCFSLVYIIGVYHWCISFVYIIGVLSLVYTLSLSVVSAEGSAVCGMLGPESFPMSVSMRDR